MSSLQPISKFQCEDPADYLQVFANNPANFVWGFVIMDENWVDHYTLETKQQSKQTAQGGLICWEDIGVSFLECKSNFPA